MRSKFPLCVAGFLLAGCLDWSTSPGGDADDAGSMGDAGAETPACPTREQACDGQCGEVVLEGCAPYACPACTGDGDACIPIATCASIEAECGALDTGCGTVLCADQCDPSLPCVDHRCCEPESDALACRGMCGGTVSNRCGREVVCSNPCGPSSDGCRDSEAPVAALCFCPHALQGETCEQTQLPMLQPSGIATDGQSRLAYILDRKLRALLRVDPETGNRSVLSDDAHDGVPHGAGPGFVSPVAMALDVRNQRAFVSDMGRLAILEVDLITGNRKVLSDGDDDGTPRGTGPALTAPKGIALDIDRDRLFVVGGTDHLFEVQLTTGNRAVFSSANFEGRAYGAGPRIKIPQDVILDLPSQKAWVFGTNALLSVSLQNGDRTLISATSTSATDEGTLRGAGFRYHAGFAGAVDFHSARALVVDLTENVLIGIDLVTGDRSVLSGDDGSGTTIGTGPGLEGVMDMELAAGGTHLLAIDEIQAAAFRIDLATGDRTVLFDGGMGPGPGLVGPSRIALDAAHRVGYVMDNKRKELLRVALDTGARSVVTGEGAAFETPRDVAIDASGSTAYVVDSRVGLLRVDLHTGARTVVSDNTNAELGPALTFGAHVVLDAARSRLLVAQTSLLAVDLTSGRRTVLSDGTRGTGPAFVSSDITLDSSRALAFAVSETKQIVIQIDLATGNRTIVSGTNEDGTIRGQGPLPVRAVGAAIDVTARVLYLVDEGSGVLRVDLTTGNRSIVSGLGSDGGGRGKGHAIYRLESIALDLSSGFAYVVDSGLFAVVRVDLESGDRWLASRVTF